MVMHLPSFAARTLDAGGIVRRAATSGEPIMIRTDGPWETPTEAALRTACVAHGLRWELVEITETAATYRVLQGDVSAPEVRGLGWALTWAAFWLSVAAVIALAVWA